jgi:hypothetical protein
MAKTSMWAGLIIILFGTNIASDISYSLGMREARHKVNHEAIALGLVLLVVGFGAYGDERD